MILYHSTYVRNQFSTFCTVLVDNIVNRVLNNFQNVKNWLRTYVR